ncbi:LuxR C-terminal-related transcriptional regulator [Devosia sp.]|uniref:LuxR family transcriptional regulator n=1 Tax=Devosia sp. TaxID=1871048 RepID=UPI003A8CCDA6
MTESVLDSRQSVAVLLERLERVEALVQSLVAEPVQDAPPDPQTGLSSRRRLARLGPRQHAMLQMLFRGASNAEISERLGVTVNTVAGNVSTLARHFGARGRTQLAARAQLEVAAVSGADYLELSGGLPLDWDANFLRKPMRELLDDDPRSALRATRQRKVSTRADGKGAGP